jgi:phenylpropionate dioxygenase-like ring-hydroxylating dioxygenase large terminal subunit
MEEPRKALSAEQYALVTAPIEKARTLPREAFFSRSFFEIEVERIYARRWVGVLFEFEVAEPGDVLPFELCGIPLVAVRGPDRKLRVFHNIVPYDGCLAVMEAASGVQRIETPYHGWVYDLYGRLSAIPFWDGTREGNLESVRKLETDLVAVACESFLHTVFVNLAEAPEPFEDFVAPLHRQFDEYDLEGATPAVDEHEHVICPETSVATNWKTYYENACLNVLHESFVHALYRASPLHPRVDESGKKTFFEIIDGDLLGLGFHYDDFTETYGDLGSDGRHLGRGEAPPDKASFSTLYPNLYFANAPEYIEISVALPDGPECTRDRRIYLMQKDAATEPASGRQRRELVEMYAGAGAEDGAICEAVQKARRSPVYSQRFYSPFWDELHYRFTRLVVRDLSDD